MEKPEQINHTLVQAGAIPSHLALDEEDLEQYFLRLVGVQNGETGE